MSETYGEKVNRIGIDLRCHRCNIFAYMERYEGEFGEDGYTCLGCIRRMNRELMDEVRRRFFEDQKFYGAKTLEEARSIQAGEGAGCGSECGGLEGVLSVGDEESS